jgi:hypothetical protein
MSLLGLFGTRRTSAPEKDYLITFRYGKVGVVDVDHQHIHTDGSDNRKQAVRDPDPPRV